MITEGVGNKQMECELATGFLGHCSRAQPDLCDHKDLGRGSAPWRLGAELELRRSVPKDTDFLVCS